MTRVEPVTSATYPPRPPFLRCASGTVAFAIRAPSTAMEKSIEPSACTAPRSEKLCQVSYPKPFGSDLEAAQRLSPRPAMPQPQAPVASSHTKSRSGPVW